MKLLAWITAIILLTTAFPAPASASLPVQQEEIVPITAHDGYVFEGKLRLPRDRTPEKLVIFVNGSGPNTYDNTRSLGEDTFRYHDLYAAQITAQGNAYFSYNTRGVTHGDTPPLYADIDEEAYAGYLPRNEVRDVAAIIRTLRSFPALSEAKVLLLGLSAGTIIAPQVALLEEVPVDGLLLAGYTHDTMDETLEWQQTGGSSMVFYRQYFDTDGSGDMSEAEFAADPYGITALLGAPFADIDQDGDGVLTAGDFALLLADGREALYDAIEAKDDAWLAEHYGVRLTSGWFHDYRAFPPNRETLLKLDLPIYIFHGEYDANVSVEGALAIEEAFRAAGKDNLTVHVIPGADHDLNYAAYLTTGEIPEGFAKIFATVEAF